MMYPSITCLCPTYGRPKLLANAIACFLAQDYPRNRCSLRILDDLGTIRGLCINDLTDRIEDGQPSGIMQVENVYAYSSPVRAPSLPEKYNMLWQTASESDIYLVWEDDDCQLPWCLSSHAKACEHHGWSYPSHVWSDYGDAGYPIAMRLHTEPCGGRFHGSLGIRGDTMRAIGGWPLTRQANFDQQMIARLRETGEPGDPLQYHCGPTAPFCHAVQSIQPNPNEKRIHQDIIWGKLSLPPYVFRWHTGQRHGQSDMQGPEDESWYDRYQPPDRNGPHTIIPAFDDDTKAFYDLLALRRA